MGPLALVSVAVVVTAAAVGIAGMVLVPELAAFHWVWPARVDWQRTWQRTPWYAWLPHLAFAPKRRRQGLDSADEALLHIFLPGTGSHAAFHSNLLAVTADAGAHTLGLSYRFSWAPSKQVGDAIAAAHPEDAAAQATALAAFHGTICEGGPGDAHTAAVDRRDSIVGRILATLTHLAEHHPTEGWSGFLGDEGQVRWGRVVLAGHSQGAAHAAFLAQRLPLRRAVLISGPQSVPSLKASHLASPFATEDIVAFAHAAEDQVASIKDALAVMGLTRSVEVGARELGSPAFVAGDAAFVRAQAVFSTVPPRRTSVSRSEHVSVATNAICPLDDDGGNLYAATVWPKLLLP